jgi:hypothetical protein
MSTRAEWKEAVLRNYRAWYRDKRKNRLRSAVVAARAKWYDPTSVFASYRNTLGGLTPYELLQQFEEAGYPAEEEMGVEDAELLKVGLEVVKAELELLQQYTEAGYPEEMGVEDAELLKEAVEAVVSNAAARRRELSEVEPKPQSPAAVKRRGRSLATRRNRPVAKNKMPSEENMLQRFEGRSRNLRTRSVNRK